MTTVHKPDFYSAEHAVAFTFHGVVASYWTRPPYPQATYDVLLGLVVDEPRPVLDLGCGTGILARNLASRVDRVDALDISRPMIEEARRQPGGDAANIRWIIGAAESALVDPPYALVVAGASLHWMDWNIVMPRLADMLTPGGVLAIVGDHTVPPPWWDELLPVILRYSTNPTLRLEFDWIAYLHERGLFKIVQRVETESETFSQPLAHYVESFHARESLTRERLTPEEASSFDREVGAIVRRYVPGDVTLSHRAHLVWGKPLSPD
jgi:SAM-dependent methyltransferase